MTNMFVMNCLFNISDEYAATYYWWKCCHKMLMNMLWQICLSWIICPTFLMNMLPHITDENAVTKCWWICCDKYVCHELSVQHFWWICWHKSVLSNAVKIIFLMTMLSQITNEYVVTNYWSNCCHNMFSQIADKYALTNCWWIWCYSGIAVE